MLTLMQQAELLSSLAIKVNSENTDQSFENAWKVRRNVLILFCHVSNYFNTSHFIQISYEKTKIVNKISLLLILKLKDGLTRDCPNFITISKIYFKMVKRARLYKIWCVGETTVSIFSLLSTLLKGWHWQHILFVK